jgi:hypothetical protein
MELEVSFYILGAGISVFCWLIALFRVRKLFTGSTGLFVGKVLMIVTLITVDVIIMLGYFQVLGRDNFRLGMGFLTGVQIIAALSVATGRRDRDRWREETDIEQQDREVGDKRRQLQDQDR